MVKIYAVNGTPLLDENALAAAMPRIDGVRAARIKRLRNNHARAALAAAGLLLTHLFGKDGKPPHLTHGSRGKPYLADNSAYFSLSHSGGWVICAVADSEVGADIQEKTPYNEKVAARWFTPPELAWLADDPDGRYARLWACKEAFAKLTGFGLVLPMSSFTVPTPADGRDDDNHCVWKEYRLDAEQTLFIAVCYQDKSEFAPLTVLSLDDIL